MPYKRFRYGGRKRRPFPKFRRRRPSGGRTSRIKRVAKTTVNRAIKRLSELKWDIWNTAQWPGVPGNTATALINLVGQRYGSIYQSTVGLTPWITEPTRFLGANPVGQNSFIGNKRTLYSLTLKMLFNVNENSATHDNFAFRFTVLQLRSSNIVPATLLNNTALTRSLMWGAFNANNASHPSVAQFTNMPWDRSKVKVLYDKVRRIHGVPTTVSPQNTVHFKSQPFNFRIKWRKGKVITYDASISTDISGTTQTRNPILVIVQGAEPFLVGPVTQAMDFGLHTESIMYMTWRDM